MSTVVKRRPERTQSASVQAPYIEVVRVETNSERFQWLEEVSRLTSVLGSGGVAFALRLFVSWNRRDGFCFPSQDTISKDLGVSRSTAGRYQKQLEEQGLLTIEKRRLRRSKHPHNVYFFTLPNIARVRSKTLKGKDTFGSEAPIAGENHVSPVTHGLPSVAVEIGTSPSERAEETVMCHQCDVTMRHQCDTNHVIEPNGEPTGSPLQIPISEFTIVAREADEAPLSYASGAPEARLDEAFRATLEQRQLVFYDELSHYDQSRYRDVPAERRDEWQDIWDYQHGIGHDDD